MSNASNALMERLEMCYELDDVLFIKGPAGVGKTQIVQQFAHTKGVQLKTVLLYGDQIGIGGVPRMGEDQTSFSKSVILDGLEENAIVFIDEITNASTAMVSTIWSALTDKEINGHPFPKGVRFVLAGNGTLDSKSARPLPVPLVSRIVTYVFNGVTPDEFKTFMTEENWHPVVAGFLSKQPDCVFQKESGDDQLPIARPRTWKSVSDLMHKFWTKDKNEFITPHVIERVGEEMAMKLRVFMELGAKMLDPVDVIARPKQIGIKELTKCERLTWMSLYSLVPHFEDNMLPIATFVDRLEPENFQLFFMLLPQKLRQAWMLDDTGAGDIITKFTENNMAFLHKMRLTDEVVT